MVECSSINNVQACCTGRHVVRYVQEVAAGGVSDAELDGAVVVPFLLDDRVVVYHITKAVVGDSLVVNREQGIREDESTDFFGLSDEPEVKVRGRISLVNVRVRVSVRVRVRVRVQSVLVYLVSGLVKATHTEQCQNLGASNRTPVQQQTRLETL